MIRPVLYTPSCARGKCPTVKGDSNVSSAAEVYKPNDCSAAHDTSEFLWKRVSLADISSPAGNEKLSNDWRSIGCVGVYKAELSGLVDRSVSSERPDDIWNDTCEILWYMPTEPFCS